MSRVWIALVVGSLLIVGGACGRGGETTQGEAAQSGGGESARSAAPQPGAGAEAKGSPADAATQIAEGRKMYEQRCATCHGEQGNGKGPAGASLQPPPRDFTDRAWQDATSAERIEQVVSYGGAAVGLSPIMPAQPDLANDPGKLEALVAYLRTFAGKSGDEQAAPEPREEGGTS